MSCCPIRLLVNDGYRRANSQRDINSPSFKWSLAITRLSSSEHPGDSITTPEVANIAERNLGPQCSSGVGHFSCFTNITCPLPSAWGYAYHWNLGLQMYIPLFPWRTRGGGQNLLDWIVWYQFLSFVDFVGLGCNTFQTVENARYLMQILVKAVLVFAVSRYIVPQAQRTTLAVVCTLRFGAWDIFVLSTSLIEGGSWGAFDDCSDHEVIARCVSSSLVGSSRSFVLPHVSSPLSSI